MVQVFFENKGCAAKVALFPTEELYQVCLPSLTKLAKEQGFDLVTESIEDPEVFILVKEETDFGVEIEGVYWTKENAEQAAKDLELDMSYHKIVEDFRIV